VTASYGIGRGPMTVAQPAAWLVESHSPIIGLRTEAEPELRALLADSPGLASPGSPIGRQARGINPRGSPAGLAPKIASAPAGGMGSDADGVQLAVRPLDLATAAGRRAGRGRPVGVVAWGAGDRADRRPDVRRNRRAAPPAPSIETSSNEPRSRGTQVLAVRPEHSLKNGLGYRRFR
jgi:hypothetical protein